MTERVGRGEAVRLKLARLVGVRHDGGGEGSGASLLRLQERVQGRRLHLHLIRAVRRDRQEAARPCGQGGPASPEPEAMYERIAPARACGRLAARHSEALLQGSGAGARSTPRPLAAAACRGENSSTREPAHPGEVRSSTAHSEGLGRSPQVPSWSVHARSSDEGRASVNAGAKARTGVRAFVRAFSIAAPHASLGVRKPVRIFYCCAQPPDTFPNRQVTP